VTKGKKMQNTLNRCETLRDLLALKSGVEGKKIEKLGL